MSKLILIDQETSEPIQEFFLRPGEMKIGRGAANDIIIAAVSVSTHHATIYTEKNDSFVHDADSTNGTFVNGKKIRNHALEDKDVLNVGSHVLLYVHSYDETKKHIAPAKLVYLNGNHEGDEILLKSAITTLGEPGVQLGVIAFRPTGLFFSHIDGGEDNTFSLLNGEPVTHEPVALEFGDTITINDVDLQLAPIKNTNQKPLV